MRSIQLNRFLFIAPLILAVSIPPAAGQANEAAPGKILVIPGGLSVVAGIVGLDDSSPDSTPEIERIFASLLESEPLPGGVSRKNVVRSDLISYLKQYSGFLQYLQEERLALPALNSHNVLEKNFLLTGNQRDLEKQKSCCPSSVSNAGSGPAIREKQRALKSKRAPQRTNYYTRPCGSI